MNVILDLRNNQKVVSRTNNRLDQNNVVSTFVLMSIVLSLTA